MNEELLRGGVVCFGGEDWWYHNRGHCDMQLMRQYARQTKVLYVNSIVMRRANIGEGRMFVRRVLRKTRSLTRGLQQVEGGFHVFSPVAAPVHHLPGARRVNQLLLHAQIRLTMRRIGLHHPLVWVNCPVACHVALALDRSGLVYQRTDRYEEFPGVDRPTVEAFDQLLKAEADLTFFSNRQLFEQERAGCRRAIYMDHGVDFERFSEADADPTVPDDLRDVPRPIIGFFGGIDDHTFDLDFMARVAAMRPQYSFVFVGRTSIDCTPMTRLPNVTMLGQRPYDQIPRYGRCFDVCLMPWRQNRWIEACNPIKLREYLALGKPIVSTPFPELESWGDAAYVASSSGEFALAIDRALADRSPGLIEKQRQRVASASWLGRARHLLEVLTSSSTASAA